MRNITNWFIENEQSEKFGNTGALTPMAKRYIVIQCTDRSEIWWWNMKKGLIIHILTLNLTFITKFLTNKNEKSQLNESAGSTVALHSYIDNNMSFHFPVVSFNFSK